MITLFAVPKPMEGEFERLQENAVGSWIRLGFGVEILLFGGERGVDAFARRLGLDHTAEVARTEFGTPRVDDLFAQAERTRHPAPDRLHQCRHHPRPEFP